ncbi:hypothetical protein AAMO2058_001473600 [Amorphochlora amoebiformis]
MMRKKRNRQSAAASRERRKKYITELEKKIEAIVAENRELDKQVTLQDEAIKFLVMHGEDSIQAASSSQNEVVLQAIMNAVDHAEAEQQHHQTSQR